MAKKQYSMRIDETLIEDLKDIAKREFRNVNNTIELALTEYVKKYKKDSK